MDVENRGKKRWKQRVRGLLVFGMMLGIGSGVLSGGAASGNDAKEGLPPPLPKEQPLLWQRKGLGTLTAPSRMGFGPSTTPEEVLAAEEGDRLKADVLTPATGQLLFRRWAAGKPFVAHYYFVDGRLSALSYYLMESPFVDCTRLLPIFETLSRRIAARYGEADHETETVSLDPAAPYNCYILQRWQLTPLRIEVWQDGNVRYDFERVGIDYRYREDLP